MLKQTSIPYSGQFLALRMSSVSVESISPPGNMTLISACPSPSLLLAPIALITTYCRKCALLNELCRISIRLRGNYRNMDTMCYAFNITIFNTIKLVSYGEKLVPYGDWRSTSARAFGMWLGPDFKGHVTKNEEVFQTSDRSNFRYCPHFKNPWSFASPHYKWGRRQILKMVQNGRISDFHGLLTLTLTLDPGQGHTVVHLSSSSTCKPNFIEIKETFCGRKDGRTESCHP